MEVDVVRLAPGQDLRLALAHLARQRQWNAACVLGAVGSLSQAALRYAERDTATLLDGPLELLTLSGTVGTAGLHLHASVADADGGVRGGHVMAGCIVRTTAEIVVGVLAEWTFERKVDDATGYPELVARRG